MQLSISACYRGLQSHAYRQSQCINSVLRYEYVCLLVWCWWVWGGGGQLPCDPDPLIYQRPRLTCRPLPCFLTMGERFPSSSEEKTLFGGSLMLMSRPVLRLRAVNRELTRLVVCLCNVVTHLKDGPYPKH